MALTIDNAASYAGVSASITHTQAVTLGAGTSRKIVVAVGAEFTQSIDSATFDGNAMTASVSAAHSTATSDKQNWFWYDVPDGAATGSKNVVVTLSSSATNMSMHIWQLSGAATGAPEYANIAESAATSTATTTNSSVSVTAGAAILAMALNAAATPSASSWSGVTERNENAEANYSTAQADSTDNTVGTKTVSVTWSSTTGEKLLGVLSIASAPPGGLSITSVTPSAFDDGRTGIVIAGSGFGASQGSSTLTIGGQAQTVTAWSDTSITFTSVRGSNSMGTRSLTITKG